MSPSEDLGVKAGRASLWMATAQLATLIGMLVVVSVGSHWLPAAEYGVFTTVSAFVAMGSMLLLGVPQAMVHEAAVATASGDRPGVRQAIGSGQAILFLAGTVAAGTLVLLAPWASVLVDARDGGASDLGDAVRVAAAIVVLITWTAGPDASLQAVHAFRVLAVRNIVATTAGTAATVAALLHGASLPVVLGTTALTPGISALVSIGAVLWHGMHPFPLQQASLAAARRILRFGLPLFFNDLTVLIHTRLDSLLLLVLWSNDTRFVAYYNAALYIAVTALIPAQLLTRAVFPMVATLTARREIAPIAEGVRRATQYLVYLGFPIVAGGIALRLELITAIFPPEYLQVATALSILFVGYGANALTYPHTATLMGLGRPRAVTINTVPTAVGILAMHIALIPYFGMNGAAVGASIPIVLGLLAYPWQTAAALRALGHPVRGAALVPWVPMGKATLACLLMVGAVLFAPVGEGVGALVARIALGAAVYLVVLVGLLGGLDPADRATLARVLNRGSRP